MIIYDLRCPLGHGFEGWFDSPGDFDRQVEGSLLACPLCESTAITRVPSAVHVKAGAAAPVVRPVAADGPPAAAGEATVDPALLAAALRRIRQWVASAEDVGAAFADEARKIHQEEAPERAIRGVTTRAEARALADEGIPVLPLPPHLVDKPH